MEDAINHIREFPTDNLNLVSFACVTEQCGSRMYSICKVQKDDIYDAAAYVRFKQQGVVGHDRSRCAVCGHALVYHCIVEHTPTGEFYPIGRDCFSNIECLKAHASQISIAHSILSKQIAAGHKAAKEKTAGDVREIEFAAKHPEFAEVYNWAKDIDLAQFARATVEKLTWPILTIKDMQSKVRKYGSLSAAQIKFAIRLHSEALITIATSEETEAKLKAAIEAGLRAPEGKQTVSGIVLGTKRVENDFGSSMKVIIQLDNGTKVYGTLPSSATGDKGAKVTFTATFEASPKDPLFAFFKRPSKWTEVTEQPVPA